MADLVLGHEAELRQPDGMKLEEEISSSTCPCECADSIIIGEKKESFYDHRDCEIINCHLCSLRQCKQSRMNGTTLRKVCIKALDLCTNGLSHYTAKGHINR